MNIMDFDFTPAGFKTTDEELNKIIAQVESETNMDLSMAIPAVTFDEDPSEKVYLVLLNIYEEEETYIREWKIKIGRQETYDYLKDLVRNEIIDPNTSFIISGDLINNEHTDKDNVNFDSQPISIYRFLKAMFENRKVLDDGEDFDINDYDPSRIYDDKVDKTILEV